MAIPPQSAITLEEAVTQLHSDADFDVIALQEVDVQQQRSGHGNQVAEIAKIIGAKYWAFAPAMYGTPGEKWHGVKMPWSSIKIHLCPMKQCMELESSLKFRLRDGTALILVKRR